MAKVVFLGKVFSPGNLINGSVPSITFNGQSKGLIIDIEVVITDNDVTASCVINKYALEDFLYVHMCVFDMVKASVNVLAFAYGISCTVVLENFIDENGTETLLCSENKSLKDSCSVLDPNSRTDYNDLVSIVVKDPALFIALDELIQSITTTHISIVNCARAVEGIRQMIAPNIKDKPQWDIMHDTLNTSRSYVELITENSKEWRHGKRTRIEGDITVEVTRRTWVIMNRFLEYRKRGNVPLPLSEFPSLTDNV